jgi:hypothetical protein
MKSRWPNSENFLPTTRQRVRLRLQATLHTLEIPRIIAPPPTEQNFQASEAFVPLAIAASEIPSLLAPLCDGLDRELGAAGVWW